MDQYVLHPFVRIHVIDFQTKKYLAKQNVNVPGVAFHENVNYFRLSENKDKKVPLKSDANFILPMSTQMYDMRIKGNNYCEWDEDFIINEKVRNLLKQNVIIIFEILDFNTDLVVQDSNLLNSDKMYPVAWAYLRPLGSASVHLDKVKLQLYQHKFHSDKSIKFNRPFDMMTPEVLLELEWPAKTKFNSFLEVELQFCNRIDHEVPRKHFARAPWEKEVGLYEYSSTQKQIVRATGAAQHEEEDLNVIKRLRKWEKFHEF